MHPPNQEFGGKYPSNTPPPPQEFQGIPQHPPHVQPGQEGRWSSGLCGCCSDCQSCCLTFWCPCITFGRIAEIVDKGNTTCSTAGALYFLLRYFTGCGCLYSCGYRTKLRRQFMLPKSPCGDCLVHCCCESCAICQEYRELKHQGFDMVIGWHANVERQNPGMAMGIAAPAFGGMTR